jgi:hypothetical protein
MKNVKVVSLSICVAIFNLIVSCGGEDVLSYSLTVQVEPEEGGSVSQRSENFISGTSVTLTATANSNYSFSTWTGSITSISNPLDIIMDEDKSVVAVFELIDNDKDGVTDDLDECPNTVEGSTVDENGCEEDITEVVATVWTGDVIDFSKADGADPALATNQDRITDKVWITRDNEGGQIYNRALENESDKDTSPLGTAWSEGALEDYASLTYTSFRTATGKPKDAVGKTYVVHLTEDNIYLSVKLNSWSQGKVGGFSYERSTAR